MTRVIEVFTFDINFLVYELNSFYDKTHNASEPLAFNFGVGSLVCELGHLYLPHSAQTRNTAAMTKCPMFNVQNFRSQYVFVRLNLGDKWMFVSCVDNVLGPYHSVLCQPCGRPCDVIRPTLTNEKLSSWPDDITRSTTRPTQ